MTAAALRRPPPDTRQLQRCLLLAVLLHVWLVLMFGNATGSAAPGQGVWGSLTVKLLGRSGGDAGAPPGDPGERGGGTPRREASPAEPGAAARDRADPAPVEAPRSDDAPPSPATLALPDGFRPVERQELRTPPRVEAALLPTPDLPTAAIGRLETRPDAAVAPLAPATSLRTPSRPAEALPQATELPAPVSRLDAAPTPAVDTPLPRPAELRATPPQAAVPSADLPPLVQRLEAPATTATRLPRATDLRPTPPAITPAATAATPLPSAVQRLEAPAAEAARASALPRPAELRTASPTSATALPSAQDLPAAVRRLEPADAAGAGVAPLQPAPNARASLPAANTSALNDLAEAIPGQVTAPAGPARGDPDANPDAAPKATAGLPDAGSRPGPNLPAPPTAAASTPGRAPLNLSLPRGDMTARRGTGAIDLIPPPPERKSKLEQSIEESANKDCRKAYSGVGILAVVPLAIDSVRGKGCKW